MTLAAKAILFFLILSTQMAVACSCAPPPPTLKTDNDWLNWRLDGISVVFEGKVANIQLSGWPLKPVAGETVHAREPLKVTFYAVHIYRGETGKEVSVATGLGMGDCGFDFQKGSRYLVFAHKDDSGNLTTSICTGTSLLKDAGNSLRLLGIKPALPEEADDSQEDIDDSNHQICGRISDASRKNMDAVQVMAWRVEDDDIALFRSQETDIKPDGQYCLDELPAGRYMVAAMQDLETPDRRLMAYYPGVLNRSRAALVSISAEEKMVHADFPLQLQHLYKVRGYLRGASTDESIEILLMSKKLNKLTVIDPAELQSNGSFQFDNVPSGHYTIYAAKENDDESLTFLTNAIEIEVDKNIEGLKLEYLHKK